jgi:predicted enzyme related to lactoylglutathione lyase
MADSDGTFVWYELMTTDTSAAKKFYPAVTGWGTQPFDKSYEMWTTGGAPLGGMMNINDEQKKNGIPPHWLPYVGVSSVDATTAQAGKLGGKVLVPPTDIGAGRFSVFADPQGAVIGIYSAKDPAPNGDFSPEVGEFSWHELLTTDYVAAFDFYRQLFAWEKMDQFDMGPMGMYQMYGKNGQMYGGMFNKSPDMPPPMWWCYVRVNDVNTAVDAVKKGGGKVMNGPMEVPGGDWIAQAADPQGALFAVHQRKS